MTHAPRPQPHESLHQGKPVGFVDLKTQGRYFKAMSVYFGLSKWGIVADLLDANKLDLAHTVTMKYDNF